MNSALFEARQAPAILERRERGKEVLVRSAMINYFTGLCDALDNAFAQLPVLLKKYDLAEYDNEVTQRAILAGGFDAVQRAVHDRTLLQMEKYNFLPKLRERYARENADAVPRGLRDELEALLREINALNRDMDISLDYASLWFKSGKLRIPPKFRADIEPRYTLEVSSRDRKAIEKIREAAAILAEIQGYGISIADQMRISPADGKAYLAPGLITRISKGEGYTDAELLGLFQGIELTH